MTPHEFVSNDEHVVSFGLYNGKFPATGLSISAPFAHRWLVRGENSFTSSNIPIPRRFWKPPFHERCQYLRMIGMVPHASVRSRGRGW